jgi:hypothetical protein
MGNKVFGNIKATNDDNDQFVIEILDDDGEVKGYVNDSPQKLYPIIMRFNTCTEAVNHANKIYPGINLGFIFGKNMGKMTGAKEK